jgi:hypothetical protein
MNLVRQTLMQFGTMLFNDAICHLPRRECYATRLERNDAMQHDLNTYHQGGKLEETMKYKTIGFNP